jgi:DNA-binding MarR family transcriptional regulator
MPKPYYTIETFEPGKSIGFLVKRCGVLMTQIAERHFESTSVSFTQWTALMRLCMQSGHMSATRLSKELGYDMGALTRVVDELERRGLVRRERSRSDRRVVEIAITAAGRRQAESAKRVVVALVNQLVEPYSDAEMTTLIELMQRMLVRLQDVAAASAADPAPVSRIPQPRRKSKSGAAA